MYVYKITNNINSKMYIGITNNYKKRWQSHKYVANKETHEEYDKVLYAAFRKYGVENFSFEVIFDNLSIQEAKEAECSLIAELGTLTKYNGYNVTPGGDFSESSRSLGANNQNAILTEEEVLDIITRRENGELQKDVYADYSDKVKRNGAFSDIWAGKSWKHLQPKVINKPNGNRYLTDAEALEVYQLASEKKFSCKSIGEIYGIPASTVSNIKNKKTYKSVTEKV